jgi:hypothetical protein
MREPKVVRRVRRASARWDSLAPRRDLTPTLEQFNVTCQRWLSSVSREAALEALEYSRVRGAEADAMVDEAFRAAQNLCLAPRVSEWARIGFVLAPSVGEYSVLVQENVGSRDQPAQPFSQPVRKGSHGVNRVRSIEFLILAARAAHLADSEGLGLDLGLRLTRGAVWFPNVLLRQNGSEGLAYIDYFGLAQRDGTRVEAAAFSFLYGRYGLIRSLLTLTRRGLRRSAAETLR